MEYKKIEEFIKNKKLDEASLIGKKIIYNPPSSLSKYGLESDDENLVEYEILEIVPAKTNYVNALMKLRSVGYGTPQEIWTYVTIINIKYVKIEPEKEKDVEKTKSSIIDNDAWKKIIDGVEKSKKGKDTVTYPPPYKNPPVRPWEIPSGPAPKTAPYDPHPYCKPNICPSCKLDCSGIMDYCCPNHCCPMRMNVVWSSTITKDTIPIRETPKKGECGYFPDSHTVCGSQHTLDDPNDSNHIM